MSPKWTRLFLMNISTKNKLIWIVKYSIISNSLKQNSQKHKTYYIMQLWWLKNTPPTKRQEQCNNFKVKLHVFNSFQRLQHLPNGQLTILLCHMPAILYAHLGDGRVHKSVMEMLTVLFFLILLCHFHDYVCFFFYLKDFIMSKCLN